MYAPERRRLVLDALRRDGRVTVARLADDLDVSAETVRRDLATLEAEGHLERTHGGAVPVTPGGRIERRLSTRDAENTEAKTICADLALSLLPGPGGSILLDAGSTTAHLARALPTGHRLTVVTNSAPVAADLVTRDEHDIHLLGGRVRGLTGACVGHVALTALARLRCDVAFLGTNGVHPERGLTTPDPEEAAVKRAMCQAARRVVVLADSAKFGHEHLVGFAALEDVDVLVTDSSPGGVLAGALADAGTEVLQP